MENTELPLSLVLECHKASAEKLTFVLLLTNESPRRLLLPHPKITNLQFVDEESGVIVEWTTHLLVQAKGLKVEVLESGEARSFSFAITGKGRLSDGRWGVKLDGGIYKVRFGLNVDENFFDGDSHWRWNKLEVEAAQHGAIAWRGSVFSNEIVVDAGTSASD